MRAFTRTSSTLSLRSSSASSRASRSWSSALNSASDRDDLHDLLRIDLLERLPRLEPGDLPLGGAYRRHRQVRGRAELLRDGQHPLDQLLEDGTRGADLSRVEVDELAGEAVANRPPEVLFDEPVRKVRRRLALVDGARDPRGQSEHERGGRLRLGQVGLPIADADLHGGKAEMRPHAPPELRVLRDGAGVVKEADIALVVVPAREDVRNSTAREHPREDLRARRVEVRVHALDERRAAGESEQVRQVGAQAVRDRDRPVGPSNADVNVQTEAVVAPDDVPEDLVVPAIVGRVDDALFLPGTPGMRARRGERDAEAAGELEELPATLAHARDRLGPRVALARAHFDLRGDELADQVLLEIAAPGALVKLLEAVDEAERPGIEDGEFLLDGDGEIATVLEPCAGAGDLRFGAELLGLTHRAKVSERLCAPSSRARPRRAVPSGRARSTRRAEARGSLRASRRGRPRSLVRSSQAPGARADTPIRGPRRRPRAPNAARRAVGNRRRRPPRRPSRTPRERPTASRSRARAARGEPDAGAPTAP